MSSQSRPLMEYRTSLAPGAVISAAKAFFTRRNTIYAAFVEDEGPSWVTFRGQGGEEIAISAVASPPGSTVTGSTYMFDFQVQRFFATLPPPGEQSA